MWPLLGVFFAVTLMFEDEQRPDNMHSWTGELKAAGCSLVTPDFID